MILGVESSCDDSALALFDPKQGVLWERVHKQVELHAEYGGVVPALASREHLVNFPHLVEELRRNVGLHEITKVAVSFGPGLSPCLAMGVATAKSLALLLGVPVVGVNHLQGHAFSPFIDLHKADPERFHAALKEQLPHLGLIASGGNTLLFEITEGLELKALAGTVDDAAGEALDKGGKLLGLPYPAGPLIEKHARGGDPGFYDFPVAFASRKDDKFSFSGLKTSLRYLLDEMSETQKSKRFDDLCASYQKAVIKQLVRKTGHMLERKTYKSIGLSGGVSNNGPLRQAISELAKKHKAELFIARPEHTADNAAMIAFCAYAFEKGCKAEGWRLEIAPAEKIC